MWLKGQNKWLRNRKEKEMQMQIRRDALLNAWLESVFIIYEFIFSLFLSPAY